MTAWYSSFLWETA